MAASRAGSARRIVGSPHLASGRRPIGAALATSKVRTKATRQPEEGDQTPAFINEVTAPMLLLLLAVLYSGNVPLLKTIENSGPLNLTAPELLALRFVSASVAILPYLAVNLPKVWQVLAPAVELGIWLWVGYSLQILGLEKSSATTTSIATALTGPIVQVLELVVDGKPLSPLVAGCSVGTTIGIALFVSAPNSAAGLESPLKPLVDRVLNFFPLLAPSPKLPHEVFLKDVPGEVLALLGAVFFAVHVWRCNRIVAEGDREGRLNADDFALALAAAQCIVTTVICMILAFFDSPYPLGEQVAVLNRLGMEEWLRIAACGVLCTGLPSVLELFAFKVVDPAVTSLIYCTIPLWGTTLGVIFLHDSFGLQSIAAGVLILVCSLAPSALDILRSRQGESKDGGHKN